MTRRWKLRRGVVAGAVAVLLGGSALMLVVLGRDGEASRVVGDHITFSYEIPRGWSGTGTEANRLIFASASIAEQYSRSFLEEHPTTGYIRVGAYAVGDRTAAGVVAIDEPIEAFVRGLYGDSVLSVRTRESPVGVGVEVLLKLREGPTEAAPDEIEVREFWAWAKDDLVVVAERWGPRTGDEEVQRVRQAFEATVGSLRVEGG